MQDGDPSFAGRNHSRSHDAFRTSGCLGPGSAGSYGGGSARGGRRGEGQERRDDRPHAYQGRQQASGTRRAHWRPLMTALKGIRVLDLGTFIAGPHCATILGEFGAEVIKVEPPNTGDSLRRLGTNTECGDTLVWLSEARNKKCVTLNLGTERGRQLLRELAAKCDIIVENFRPGTLEKWGLSYDELKKLNRGAILVRISAYGQDGPMRSQPGFARIAHAFSGLSYLAGVS